MARVPQQHRVHPVNRRLQQNPRKRADQADTQNSEPSFQARAAGIIRSFWEEFRKSRAGWGASLLLHAALLLCLYGIIIGLKERPAEMSIDSVLIEESGEQPFDTVLDDTALNPAELELPDQSQLVAEQEFLVPESDNLIASSQADSGLGTEPGGEQSGGEVGFFGALAAGDSFVFIVDSSGSMTGQRFDRAKKELLRSIGRLKSRQKFHVVFFNSETYPMYTPNEQVGLVVADSSNRTHVRRWIRRQEPGSTTNPEGAIRMALGLKPAAIFLLSDGEFDEPQLCRQTAIDENSGNTVIHTIAFMSQDGEETLKAIAKDHRGTYRFVK